MFLGASALLLVASAGATACWCASMPGEGMPMPGGWTMSMAWMRMPGQTWLGATASFMAMWVLMMVAMMLPSLVPMLSSYRRAACDSDGMRLGGLTMLAAAAYFLVWSLVGACAYPLGVGLGTAAMRSDAVARSVPLATGVVLVLAGGVQLTAWKMRQLGCCRNAAGCAAVRAEAGAAWRYGLRLGAHCSLCCSGLMAALLVAGVMDLGAMVVVATAITAERHAARPERVARASGLVVVATGAVAIVRVLRAA